MTMHDPMVEVTCDGEDCWASVELGMNYVYGAMHESTGRYVLPRPSEIAYFEWVTEEHPDGDMHFCPDCAVDREPEA